MTTERDVRYQPLDPIEDTEVEGVELHLTAHVEDFLKLFARRIKKAGGSYSDVRGYTSTRFVKLPLDRANALGYGGLFDELMQHGDRRDKTCTIIFRNGMYEQGHSNVIVQYATTLKEAVEKYRRAIENSARAGYVKLPDEVRAERAAAERQEAERKRRNARADLKLDGQSYSISADEEAEVRRELGIDTILKGAQS